MLLYHIFTCFAFVIYLCECPLWITTHYSTSARLYESLFISPSLRLAISACRRQHSWDWCHLSEIYPLWSFGTQESHWHPTHLQRILLGLVAWQHWLIGLAGLRKGLARAKGIRSLPLIILSLRSAESWGRSHENQSPAFMSERGLLRTQGSRERHSRLCVVTLSNIP